MRHCCCGNSLAYIQEYIRYFPRTTGTSSQGEKEEEDEGTFWLHFFPFHIVETRTEKENKPGVFRWVGMRGAKKGAMQHTK